jgi:hypothetical protein
MFLKDIPEELLEVERFNYWHEMRSGGMRNGSKAQRPARVEKHEESHFEYDDLLPLGTSVLHDKFGRGVIVGREGGGEGLIVAIQFERAGVKKIMAKYANLEILGR